MQSTVCRGCRRPLIDEKSGRNIFDDDSLIKSFNHDGAYNNKWFMKLCTGIELITGQKVTKEEKLPQKLCEVCFQNVEVFINFRYQLLRSRDILLGTVYQDTKVVADIKSVEIENSLLNTPAAKVNVKEAVEKLPNLNVFQNELCSSPLISKTIVNTPLLKATSEDLINVDDSSNTSLDVNGLPNEDAETNDSLNCRLQNDQENNNLNDSDNSDDNPVGTNVEVINVKVPLDHDIESEIDVCSGEDDEVLELDVQKMKNETVEIDSSSESDIEVCDYEPTGKKGNYNTLTPPIRF